MQRVLPGEEAPETRQSVGRFSSLRISAMSRQQQSDHMKCDKRKERKNACRPFWKPSPILETNTLKGKRHEEINHWLDRLQRGLRKLRAQSAPIPKPNLPSICRYSSQIPCISCRKCALHQALKLQKPTPEQRPENLSG